ncbi:hypothetical protein M4I32_13810 [Microbacterium sp. LRZ72]|uniref:hypothetical protein n=1 Tax=Microbacterium sp. LRZ72 TaxID=2942481 RepID=UPI0029AFBC14|nr:hypothetical protein [Microbacterium sp. LRZ72]MDX2377873.1 hypothetical protein [Microbacterium sp. LRZ72]
MRLDEHLPVEEWLTLLVEKYQPLAPTGLIANVVCGLGDLDDVEDDPSLPEPREPTESFWSRRQHRIIRQLGL